MPTLMVINFFPKNTLVVIPRCGSLTFRWGIGRFLFFITETLQICSHRSSGHFKIFSCIARKCSHLRALPAAGLPVSCRVPVAEGRFTEEYPGLGDSCGRADLDRRIYPAGCRIPSRLRRKPAHHPVLLR